MRFSVGGSKSDRERRWAGRVIHNIRSLRRLRYTFCPTAGIQGSDFVRRRSLSSPSVRRCARARVASTGASRALIPAADTFRVRPLSVYAFPVRFPSIGETLVRLLSICASRVRLWSIDATRVRPLSVWGRKTALDGRIANPDFTDGPNPNQKLEARHGDGLPALMQPLEGLRAWRCISRPRCAPRHVPAPCVPRRPLRSTPDTPRPASRPGVPHCAPHHRISRPALPPVAGTCVAAVFQSRRFTPRLLAKGVPLYTACGTFTH